MNCDEVSTLMGAAAPLPRDALEHLRECRICSQLAAIGLPSGSPAIDPETERRIIASITTGLRPIRPVKSSSWYALAIAVAVASVAAAGIRILGAAGWRADSLVQRLYFTVCLAGGVGVSAITLARLMIPGSLMPLPPRVTLFLAASLLAGGAFLYPAANYNHFWRAVDVCFCIGLGHTTIASVLIWSIVRRGAFLSPRDVAPIIAMIGGLTGMLVLFTFCPHRNFGHFSLAHSTVPTAAAALGCWIGRQIP